MFRQQASNKTLQTMESARTVGNVSPRWEKSIDKG
jgi:hypothetical protein